MAKAVTAETVAYMPAPADMANWLAMLMADMMAPRRTRVMSVVSTRMPSTLQKLPLVRCHERRMPSHTLTFSRMRAAAAR